MKRNLRLLLPCALIVFAFGARVAPFGQNPSPNQSKSSAVNVSAVVKTTPQGNALPPLSFPVPSSAYGNNSPGELVKLRGLLARAVSSHSVAPYDTARGAGCLYSISAHTLMGMKATCVSRPNVSAEPEARWNLRNQILGSVDDVSIVGDMATLSGRGTLADGTPVQYTAVVVGNQPLIGANLFSINWVNPTGSVFQT